MMEGREIWLDLTHACNLSCSYCYTQDETVKQKLTRSGNCTYEKQRVWDSKDFKIMSTETIFSLFEQYFELGGEFVMLSGGEPTLRSDLVSIIEKGHDLGIKIALGTNGTNFGLDLCQAISNYEVSSIQIKTDGPKTIQDRLSGEGSWNRMKEGMDLLSTMDHMPFVIGNCVLSRSNMDYLEDIVLNAINLHADVIQFQAVFWGNAQFFKKNKLHPEDSWVADEMLELKQRYRHEIQFGKNAYIHGLKKFIETGKRPISTCSAGKTFMYIDPFGRVFLCPYDWIWKGNIQEEALSEMKIEPIKEKLPECDSCFSLQENYHYYHDDE